VEQYVLQKCFDPEAEDSDDFVNQINGGGWQGWHCEGGPIRSLYALLMWDIIFSGMEDVFQTAYQDAPLDFLYPSFCRKRQVTNHRLFHNH
jgi:hypothetical protein